MYTLLVLSVLLCTAHNSFAFHLFKEQITVHKGDTFLGPARSTIPNSYILPPDDFKHHYKLFGIETPHTEQPYGKEAIELLRTILHSRNSVKLSSIRNKGNRKTLVKASVNGSDISGLLVGHGLAWVRGCGTSNYCMRLKRLEQEVKEKEIGLWASANPIKPWIWQTRKRYSTNSNETNITDSSTYVEKERKAITISGKKQSTYPPRANLSYTVTTDSGKIIRCSAIAFRENRADLYTGRYLISINSKQIVDIAQTRNSYDPF